MEIYTIGFTQSSAEHLIAAMQAAIARHPRTLLSVGLSRAHRYEPQQPARHWLQVNNLHLSEA